jgi:membrane protease YdiL (CAAX protease family)
MLRWGQVVVAYFAASACALTLAYLLRGASPLSYGAPWLALSPATSHVYSALIGLAVGGLVVVSTRVFVTHFAWARNLHRELRPVARALSGSGIAAVALSSALGEELLFRGLLMPWLGLWLQALVFGVVHSQLRGPSKWAWVVWATIMGLAFGAIYALSGSLLGPICAHALINWLNLAYLKTHDTEPPRRALGGLLGQRS